MKINEVMIGMFEGLIDSLSETGKEQYYECHGKIMSLVIEYGHYGAVACAMVSQQTDADGVLIPARGESE